MEKKKFFFALEEVPKRRGRGEFKASRRAFLVLLEDPK